MTIAVVFPGQGSQSVGMLGSLLTDFEPAREIFEKANTILGYDLAELISSDSDDKLNQTAFTQPALLTTEYALWQCWQSQSDCRPAYFAGHSLGEYTALVCAKAMTFEHALQLVKLRGELMQQAVAEGIGAMAAIIGLEDKDVERACREVSSEGAVVAAANYNSPGQVVVSGYAVAVDAAMALCKKMSAKLVKRLTVSVPSHSPLMKAAADAFAIALPTVPMVSPETPVLHNVDVKSHSEPEAIKQALIAQLHSPVRWTETINFLVSAGVETIVECGPGKVLNGLTKRINKTVVTRQIASYEDCLKGEVNV